MGQINEVQKQTTMSYGDNSFTTLVKDNAVIFDSEQDKFIFADPVYVAELFINNIKTNVFTEEEKNKLDNITDIILIKGRVDTVADLPTENVRIGDVYLVGLSGSENFQEYLCVDLQGSPLQPVWENMGSTRVQSDWNEADPNSPSYIKNKPTIPDTPAQSDWSQSDSSALDYIKNKPTLATVATTGDYDDLDNKPTIPAAQIQSDWEQDDNALVDFIKNKPVLATVATTGDYSDLDNKPTIPAVQIQSDWDQSDNTAKDYIKNKPTIPGPQEQSDWDESDTNSPAYIKNKPTISGQQILSDWAQNSAAGADFVKNRTHWIETLSYADESSLPLSLDGTTAKATVTDHYDNRMEYRRYTNWLLTYTLNDTVVSQRGTSYSSAGGVDTINFGTGAFLTVSSGTGVIGIKDQSTNITITDFTIDYDYHHELDDDFIPDTITRNAGLATVATSGSYNDLSNKPIIPTAQIQSDWMQSDNTKLDFIKNKPTLATVATSGSYTDLSNTPTIPSDGVDIVSPTASSSYTLVSDKYYSLGTLGGNTTITFTSPSAGKTGIYSGQFTMGSTVVTVTFPVGVTFKTTPVYAANKTYQFSVVNNLGVIIEF